MQKKDFNNIKNIYGIFRNEKYVVMLGRNLWIFQVNGTYVACRKDIVNPYKIAFLPGDRLLVNGGNKQYNILSLTDGSEIWNVSQVKREGAADRFALSPDGMYAYDYYEWKDDLHFVRIDLKELCGSEYIVSPGLRATGDIICDNEGTPCLLQRHYSVVSGSQISENGILLQYQENFELGSSYYWKYKWTFPSKQISHCFLDDADTIITNDLHVYRPSTGESYYLLENTPLWQPPENKHVFCRLDYSKKYIVVQFCNANAVIDYAKRELVACYASGYRIGCIVEDEFWIGSENGVQRKPFPMIENIPDKKAVFWDR